MEPESDTNLKDYSTSLFKSIIVVIAMTSILFHKNIYVFDTSSIYSNFR